MHASNGQSEDGMIGKRGFAIIFNHYNSLRAFIDTFGINVYDDLPYHQARRDTSTLSSTKLHYAFINQFNSDGLANNFSPDINSTTMTT